MTTMAQPVAGYGKLFTDVFEIPGHYVNDHALIRAGDLWHLFFIEGSMHAGPGDRTNETIIGHATSADLCTWELREPALRTASEGSLDGAHIYAPGIIAYAGKYFMFYAGNEKSFDSGEHLFLATSTDLFHWARYSPNPILAPDTSWGAYYPQGFDGGQGGPQSSRDPFILLDNSGDFTFICYYVANLKGEANGKRKDGDYSCIAAATSSDLIHWKDRGPVLTRRSIGEDSYTWGHPESPCVIFRENRYYLFWKGGAGTRYVISDDPLDFQDRDEYFLATSHASKVFEWNDRWYITSCSRDVDDVTHSRSDRQRGLFLASIVWEGKHPVVVPLQIDSLQERGR